MPGQIFARWKVLSFGFLDIPDGKYLKFKYPWYLGLWIHKGAEGDTWPMSLIPTNGDFGVMWKNTSWEEKTARGS